MNVGEAMALMLDGKRVICRADLPGSWLEIDEGGIVDHSGNHILPHYFMGDDNEWEEYHEPAPEPVLVYWEEALGAIRRGKCVRNSKSGYRYKIIDARLHRDYTGDRQFIPCTMDISMDDTVRAVWQILDDDEETE